MSARPTTGSLRGCLHGLTYINNETISSWSHIVGCVIFAVLPLGLPRYVQAYYPDSITSATDVLVLAIYSLGVSICFALSAT